MFVASLILISLGLALWLVSRVGITASHHPFCRACGFNLFMLPLESKRCPECGADILTDDAIRIGHRQPIRAGQIIAAVVTLGGILLLLLSLILWWPTFDGSRFKTVTQLQHDIALPDAKLRARTCAELQHRLAQGSLTSADTDRLAQAILKLQIDPTVPWEPRWGDLLQHAHFAPGSPLAPALWQKFLEQSMQLTATVRPRIRSGDPLPIGITCRLKAGTDWRATAATFTPAVETNIAALSGQLQGRTQTATSLAALEWTLIWQPAQPLPPGPQKLHLSLLMTAREGPATITRPAQFDLSLECLDPTLSSVTLETHPNNQVRLEFEDALHWRLKTHDDGTLALAAPTLGNLWITNPPLTAAFRVVLRQSDGADSSEWLLAHFMVQPGDDALVPLRLPRTGPHPGPAEILCLPDPTLPTGTPNILQIWGTEIHHPITLAP